MKNKYIGGHSLLRRDGSFATFDPADDNGWPAASKTTDKSSRAKERDDDEGKRPDLEHSKWLVSIAIQQIIGGEKIERPPKRAKIYYKSMIEFRRGFHKWAMLQDGFEVAVKEYIRKRPARFEAVSDPESMAGKKIAKMRAIERKRVEKLRELREIEKSIESVESEVRDFLTMHRRK
jgi:hypothetical protein